MWDLWFLWLTCCANKSSVERYLRCKFICYIEQVLGNTCSAQLPVSYVWHCYSNFFTGGSHSQFCSLLESTEALIVGDFALALMEDEHLAKKWTFDNLNIIVPCEAVALLKDFFAALDYRCKINEYGIHALPDALQSDVYDYMLRLTSTPPPTSPVGWGRIELIICYRDRMDKMDHVAEALSTRLASFVTPTGIFCAHPQLTFNHQALAMNHFPTTQMLQIHALFSYELWLSNTFWSFPCDLDCPGQNRCLKASFAVVPFGASIDTSRLFGASRWWRIKADCHNVHCPYFGS